MQYLLQTKDILNGQVAVIDVGACVRTQVTDDCMSRHLWMLSPIGGVNIAVILARMLKLKY
jgi:hypothetical protein